ncbi:MAG: hypothetical protein ACXWFB_04780 [Nitrososphaeraceae archaeon]
MENTNNTKEDWTNNIRSDLWNTMDVSQLNIQRELIINKISTLQSIQLNQTVLHLMKALHIGLEDLNALIDSKSSEQKLL